MSRVFKTRENQITQGYKAGVHNAVDLVGYNMCLDYIVAHSDGEVVGVRSNYKTIDKTGVSYGNYVKIKHNNGYYTLYAHLSYGSVTVKLGDKVTKGQTIGYMGATGHTNGAHLHFEVRNEKDVMINPVPYINASLPNNATEPQKKPSSTTGKKSIEDVAKAVIAGEYGNGIDRAKNVIADGYDYDEVQSKVNEIMNGSQTYTSSSPETHRVSLGENLSIIAVKHRTSVSKLIELNKNKYPQIATSNGNYIQAGWVLTVK